METNFNKETGKTTWGISKWYEKTFYVVGVMASVFYALCFIAGVLIGIAEL